MRVTFPEIRSKKLFADKNTSIYFKVNGWDGSIYSIDFSDNIGKKIFTHSFSPSEFKDFIASVKSFYEDEFTK